MRRLALLQPEGDFSDIDTRPPSKNIHCSPYAAVFGRQNKKTLCISVRTGVKCPFAYLSLQSVLFI